MTTIIVNNSIVLKSSFFVELFLNKSLKISAEELQRIMDVQRNIVNNTTEYSEYSGESANMDCGGRLEELASLYAEQYHYYCALFVCLVGTITNVFNVIVLTRRDMFCAPINRILTALAVADMTVMVEYIPFAYYYHIELLGKSRDFPYIGAVYILFHNHVAQTLHTISICLNLTLAIWRYLALAYPERSHVLCSTRRCTIAIALSYLLPVVLCSPTYFFLEIGSTLIREDGQEYVLYHTALSGDVERKVWLLRVNFWTFAVLIKLLPCVILTIISCWLVRTLFKAKKRKQVLKAGYNSCPLTVDLKENGKRKVTKSERRADRTTKMLIAVLLLFLITEFPQGLFAMFIGFRGKDLFLECYQKYGEVMDILALANGAINFVLYCCMNRMFRITFGQLFKKRLLGKLVTAPASEIHTTSALNGTNTTTL